MEGQCSTGQGSQRAVVPMEEEEEESPPPKKNDFQTFVICVYPSPKVRD